MGSAFITEVSAPAEQHLPSFIKVLAQEISSSGYLAPNSVTNLVFTVLILKANL